MLYVCWNVGISRFFFLQQAYHKISSKMVLELENSRGTGDSAARRGL
jgi:hypothetical protein